jgi:hypothetical protein
VAFLTSDLLGGGAARTTSSRALASFNFIALMDLLAVALHSAGIGAASAMVIYNNKDTSRRILAMANNFF